MPSTGSKSLSDETAKLALARLTAELERRKARTRLAAYSPYDKQHEFHAAGAAFRERLLMAGKLHALALATGERGVDAAGELRDLGLGEAGLGDGGVLVAGRAPGVRPAPTRQTSITMPGFGRMSRPVPQPVLVMSWRTGQLAATSGRDPHPGVPPGPPAETPAARAAGIAASKGRK